MKSSFVELEGRDKRRPIQYLDIKVTMESRNKGEAAVEELLERVDISKVMTNSYDAIVLGRLLAQLQLYYNIPLENKEIAYFLSDGQVFITCGIFPIGQDVTIDLKEINLDTFLHIKAKNLGLMSIDRLMYTQNTVSNIQNQREEASQDEESQAPGKGKKQCRRTKQRRIGYIIEKVIEWRKYYSGTADQSRQTEKYSLEEAAKKVGISKKSLDDYLFQIRFGYRFGFNFNEHYNQKVGILRDFVRQQKKASKGDTRKKRKNKDTKEEQEE